ncbi:MAG: cytochrome c [Leadbetterella sp.]|nr:cytochrome c [Leadbetterella sp.]
MKKTLWAIILTLILFGCGKGAKQRAESPETSEDVMEKQEIIHGTEVTEVKLTNPLDAAMVKQGQEIFEMKCMSCHRLDETRLVGPGWSGVTKRRTAVWLTNMITNVDIMLEKDADAQKMLEECLIRMPNQNVSLEESRSIIEFMRKNDGEI